MAITTNRFLANKADDYEGWVAARRTGVTATQVANASTPAGFERAAADFILEYREPDNPYMVFGRDYEEFIADWVEAEFGVLPNEWLIAGENPKHLATPDGLSADHKRIGEYKTTGKDWETVERLPLRYVRQIQWQLHVTGANDCVVAWLLREERDGEFIPGWMKPKSGIIKRDPEMIEGLIATADRLWHFVNGGN